MFEKWDIPDNICENFPIGKGTLELFVGHNSQTKFLKKLLNNKSIVIVEGNIGVGKTSFGNYVRHSIHDIITPINEIPCDAEWNNDTFLTIILAAIVKSVNRKNSKHQKFANTSIFKKVEKLFADIDSISFGLTIAGTGGSISRNLSHSAILNQTMLLDYLYTIAEKAADCIKPQSPIIIQLNNVDISHTFSESQVNILFNKIRDTLQIPNISWIISGSEMLSGYISTHVPRVGQIISKSEKIQPLTLDEMKEVFDRRIKSHRKKGKLPLSEDLLSLIHNVSSGSFREILKVINQLLIAYSPDPLTETIEVHHAKTFFREDLNYKMNEIERKNTQYKIFKGIIDNPGINQKSLCEKISKKQTLVSKYTKNMEKTGLIRIVKHGINNHYYPSPDFHIGFS